MALLTSVPVGVVDDADGFNRVLSYIVLELAPDTAWSVEPVPRDDLGRHDRTLVAHILFGLSFPGPIGAPFALPPRALRDRDFQDDVVGQGVVGRQRPCGRVVVAQIQGDRDLRTG